MSFVGVNDGKKTMPPKTVAALKTRSPTPGPEAGRSLVTHPSFVPTSAMSWAIVLTPEMPVTWLVPDVCPQFPTPTTQIVAADTSKRLLFQQSTEVDWVQAPLMTESFIPTTYCVDVSVLSAAAK